MFRSLVTHTAAAICGALSSYAFIQQFSQEEKKEKDSDQQDEHFPGSILHPITIFQPNPNLSIAYNAQSKIPCYVVERISMDRKYDQSELISRSKIKQNFYEESTILPTHQRSRNSYFHKSGFDKGHLAPASNYRHSEEEMRDTFCLTNIAPQTPLVNRVIMSRLEEFTRNLLVVGLQQDSNDDKKDDHDDDDGKEAYIITGPMFLPNQIIHVQNNRGDDYDHMKKLYQYTFQGIGEPPSIVHVPTHFFKMVITLTKTKGEKSRLVVDKFAAWVIPNNDEFFHKMNDTINLQDFLVRPTDIEAVTGIRFFAKDDNSHGQIQIMDILTESVWSEQGKKSNVLLLSDGGTRMDNDKVQQQQRYVPSKSKQAKNRKQLQEFDSHIPSHFCARGKCNHIIKLWKNNIPQGTLVGRT
jgi:endonuclease G, mitochondrial